MENNIAPQTGPEIIVFDFDNTLFDTEKIKRRISEIPQLYGEFTPAEVNAIYRSARDDGEKSVFTIERYVMMLERALEEKGLRHDRATLQNMDVQLLEGIQLFSGVKELLAFWKEKNLPMYLLSLGVVEWQQQKVTVSGADAFFPSSHMIFTTNGKNGKEHQLTYIASQLGERKKILLYNDKPDETARLLDAIPQLSAMVHRHIEDLRYSDTDFAALDRFGDRAIVGNSIPELFEKTTALFTL